MTTVANGRKPRVLQATELEHATTGLADALLAFHAEAPKLTKNADGQIQSRLYRYVTLDGMLDDVEPLLLAHGLLWTAKVTTEDGKPAALYRMTHVPSGEIDEWTGPLPCIDPGPQALGSAITYMRRYTLVAYLNLAPGDDDDGHAASRQNGVQNAEASADQNAQTQSTLQSAPRPDQPTAAAPKPSERPCSAKQRNMLQARSRAAGLTHSAFADAIKQAAGEQPLPWTDEDAAERWLRRALDRLPARLVDTVIEGIER